jgi:two-component system sensor histidine kinase VicK
MKIKYKFFLAFLVTSLTLTALAALIFYHVTKGYFEFQLNQQLRSLTQAKVDSVDVYLRTQRDLISSAVLFLDLPQLLSGSATASELQGTKRSLELLMNNGASNIYAIYIIDDQNRIVLSTNEADQADLYDTGAVDYSQSERGVRFEAVKYCEATRKPCFAGVVPVYNQFNGRYEGSLIMDFSLDLLNSGMMGLAGMGKTGDSYVVDHQGLFMTESRFSPNSSLRQQASRSQLTNCQVNSNFGLDLEKIYIASNYNNHGIAVLSTCVSIPNIDWYLILEIDQAEALSFMDNILIVALLLILLVLIFSYFFASGFARSLIDPILRLQKAVAAVEQGDWAQKVELKSRDELGVLAGVFNRMTAALQSSQKDMSAQVIKQTKKVNLQKQDLYDQQRAVLNILEDIEDEKAKADTERDKLDAVVQSMVDGVLVVDQLGKIILFNKAAELISGCASKEVIGRNYLQTFNLRDELSDRPLTDFFTKAISDKQVERLTDKAILVRPDGQKLPVSGSAAPLFDRKGDLIGCAVVIRDVSREREVDRMKTEFISITSHQMRTPLSTINWYLEALLTGSAGELTADQLEFIKQIDIGKSRMIKLVNSMLNISRIEAGRLKIDPEPTDIIAWLKEEINEVDKVAKQNNLTINFAEPSFALKDVPLDQGLWQQVIQNFLSNAIKYSIDSTEKTITVALTKNQDSFIISVKDSGIGIPQADQVKIFQKFYRAANALHSDTDGTGIGLYVTRMVADLVGGKIWFESVENHGSTFYASLPLTGMSKKHGDRKLEIVK